MTLYVANLEETKIIDGKCLKKPFAAAAASGLVAPYYVIL